VRAHEFGVVTAASLMVRREAAAAAAAIARGYPDLAVGLHLDLGEWAFDAGEWRLADFVVDTTDVSAGGDGGERQLDAFVRLVGREPAHIDGHQHMHLDPNVEPIVARAAAAIGATVRHRDSQFAGGFYGQTGKGDSYPEWITPASLIALLSELPPG